jgi:predicted ABC-type ATPase
LAYLCADLIAAVFTHLDVLSRQIEAGREFIRRSERQLEADVDFVIESTMSGRTLRSFLARARSVGFGITIFFIYLDSPETCVARVQQRVRRGGHHVPEEDNHRRFTRSCSNFWRLYREIADYWYVVYNSAGDYTWIASGVDVDAVRVHDEAAFQQFLRLAGVNDVEIDS